MDQRIVELIEQWEDVRRAGGSISLEDLCRHCPELLDDLSKRIKALEATKWMDQSIDLTPGEHDRPGNQRSQVGRYQLRSQIGRGGFGEVWQAFDPDLDRLVAIKFPRPDGCGSLTATEKFLDEARKVARLKHPGIVPVHDVGREDDVSFIVSEFVNGNDLKRHAQLHPMSPVAAALLVAEVADALDYAHRQGVVHRDVKPQNILVDGDGQPHLTDFGIAITEDQPIHEKNSTVGTLAYMSPEQAQSQTDRIDARTDTYSLGVVLYELLVGRLPFVADDPMNLWASIVSSSPRPLRTIEPAIPVALERACLKALAKKPEDRFSTAGDFARQLRAGVAKSSRRYRWLVVAAASVVVGLGLVVLEYRRSWEQVDRLTSQSQILGDSVRRGLDDQRGAAKTQLESIPKLLESQPSTAATSAQFALALGKVAVNRQGNETAIRAFSAALDNDPTVADAWHGRGAAHFNRRDFVQAESDFRKAVQLRPTSLEFRKNHAFALVRLNRHDEAVQSMVDGLEQAKHEDRTAHRSELARIYKARAVWQQSVGDHKAALLDLQEAVRFATQNADAIHDLGCAYFNLGDFEAAVEQLNKAIRLDPTKADYFLHRGHALRKLSKEDQGLVDYETARRLSEKPASLPKK